MFLAWKEIRHQPLRFALIAAVIALMSFATFLLAGLASGLAFHYRSAAEQLGAASIVLTADSNGNVSASRFTPEQVESATGLLEGRVEPLSLVPAVAVRDQERANVYLFGMDTSSFVGPKVVQGRAASDLEREVVVDASIVEDGYALGEQITITGSSHPWTIVGLAQGSTFITLPVVYVDAQALRESASDQLPTPVTALAVETQPPGPALTSLQAEGMAPYKLKEFIQTLPGYNAQVLTFSLMIGALILISAMTLAIFLYVLTLQKRPVLGILKARGVPTKHLVWAGASQTVMLSAAGVLLGFALTFAVSFALPAKVPFRLDYLLDLGIMAGFVLFAVLGGLTSIRVVSKIDPVEAIA